MADAEGEAPVEAPPEEAPPAEEAAPAEGGEAAAAPVDKLAKWKKATRLQVNAMRVTGAKGVPGGLAFGASADAPAEGEAAATAPKKDMGALWKKAGKFVKTATAFGSKPETAEHVPDDFRMPASIEADAAKAAAEAAAAAAEAPAPSAAASRWAKAKKGVSMVRALSGNKETEYKPEPEPEPEPEAIVEPEAEERESMVGAEEVPPPASPAKPATPPPSKPATPPPAPAAPSMIPMAEVNARVAALEDLAKYSLGLNPEPPVGMAGGSRARENLLMQEINDMRWRLKGLESVEANNRAVTNAANGLRGSFNGELGAFNQATGGAHHHDAERIARE